MTFQSPIFVEEKSAPAILGSSNGPNYAHQFASPPVHLSQAFEVNILRRIFFLLRSPYFPVSIRPQMADSAFHLEQAHTHTVGLFLDRINVSHNLWQSCPGLTSTILCFFFAGILPAGIEFKVHYRVTHTLKWCSLKAIWWCGGPQ